MLFRIASILSLALFLLVGVNAQAQTASLDATVGASSGRGGGRNYFDQGGAAAAVTLAFRHQHRSGTVAAFTFGKRGSLAHGDDCALEIGTSSVCRPLFPSVTHVGVLGGIERSKSGSTLRAVAGPALFGGGVRSSVGGQLLMDAAFGGEHVAFVMAARGSVVSPFSHAPLRVGSLSLACEYKTARMIMRVNSVLIALLALLPLHAVHAQQVSATDSVLRREYVGCYSVTLGAWSGPFPSGSPAAHQPPSRIRLDSAFFAPPFAPSSYRQMTPNIPALVSRRVSPPGWRALAADSLELYWSSGFVGVRLYVSGRRDSLSGRAVATHDVMGPQPTAPVVLRRVSCTGE